MTLQERIEHLAKEVGELEKSSGKEHGEIQEVRATLLVNFGPRGKALSGLVDETQTTLQMVLSLAHFAMEGNR